MTARAFGPHLLRKLAFSPIRDIMRTIRVVVASASLRSNQMTRKTTTVIIRMAMLRSENVAVMVLPSLFAHRAGAPNERGVGE